MALKKDMDPLADRIVLLVKAAVSTEMAPLRERIAVLESKNAELERQLLDVRADRFSREPVHDDH